MPTQELIEKAYSRKKELSLKNHNYCSSLFFMVDFFLHDDLNNQEDMTSELFIPEKKKAQVQVLAKEPGIVSGSEEVAYIYGKYNAETVIKKRNGDAVKKGDTIMEIKGNYLTLLRFERLGLNILQRMSGIATTTNRLVKSLNGTKVMLAATRKVQFGMLDKRAVEDGGAYSHRLGLYESFLIKDNHLEMLKKLGAKNPIKEAVTSAFKSRELSHFIEVEAKSTEEAVQCAEIFREFARKDPSMPYIIMLDNMGVAQIKETVKELEKRELRDAVILEASGGINESNLKEYGASGVDVISMGALTHSVKALDISQNII